jgi:putative acetyltransferase
VENADEITVELVQEPTDDVRALIGELDRILSAEYTLEQRHGLALDAIFKPEVRFFLARLRGAAIGCGGVAFFTGFAEVKRMYVRDFARGSEAARALLARIEGEAREAGFLLLKLETGVRQSAALGFYEREGFQPCPAFWRLPNDGASSHCHQPVPATATQSLNLRLADRCSRRPARVREQV